MLVIFLGWENFPRPSGEWKGRKKDDKKPKKDEDDEEDEEEDDEKGKKKKDEWPSFKSPAFGMGTQQKKKKEKEEDDDQKGGDGARARILYFGAAQSIFNLLRCD